MNEWVDASVIGFLYLFACQSSHTLLVIMVC